MSCKPFIVLSRTIDLHISFRVHKHAPYTMAVLTLIARTQYGVRAVNVS